MLFLSSVNTDVLLHLTSCHSVLRYFHNRNHMNHQATTVTECAIHATNNHQRLPMMSLRKATRCERRPTPETAANICAKYLKKRSLHSTIRNFQEAQLLQQDEQPAPAKRVRPVRARPSAPVSLHDNEKWKVTVGLEIHAQLNAKRKLFSRMSSSQTSER